MSFAQCRSKEYSLLSQSQSWTRGPNPTVREINREPSQNQCGETSAPGIDEEIARRLSRVFNTGNAAPAHFRIIA
jgi:hypothetical protein